MNSIELITNLCVFVTGNAHCPMSVVALLSWNLEYFSFQSLSHCIVVRLEQQQKYHKMNRARDKKLAWERATLCTQAFVCVWHEKWWMWNTKPAKKQPRQQQQQQQNETKRKETLTTTLRDTNKQKIMSTKYLLRMHLNHVCSMCVCVCFNIANRDLHETGWTKFHKSWELL